MCVNILNAVKVFKFLHFEFEFLLHFWCFTFAAVEKINNDGA